MQPKECSRICHSLKKNISTVSECRFDDPEFDELFSYWGPGKQTTYTYKDRLVQSLVINKLRVHWKLDTGVQTVQCFATPLAGWKYTAFDFCHMLDQTIPAIGKGKLHQVKLRVKFHPVKFQIIKRPVKPATRGSSYCWCNINKGSPQGSGCGPYLFNLFINDLDLLNCLDASSKYVDETTMQVIINKAGTDCANDGISQYLSWSSTNYTLQSIQV